MMRKKKRAGNAGRFLSSFITGAVESFNLALFCFIIAGFVNAHGAKPYLDIAALGHEQYQDIIINGVVVQTSSHYPGACEERYKIIETVLNLYHRPFSMLDIGASQGYYSFRAAAAYPESVFVMIDGNNPHYPLIGNQLLDLCMANTDLNNIIFLNKSIEAKDLQHFSECEHIDVTLALNVIHWFGESWREVTNAILNMGDNIIIETPPQESLATPESNFLRKQIEDYLLSKGAEVIGRVRRHTSQTQAAIYLIRSNKKILERKTWLTPKMTEKSHVIISNFNQKKLYKKVGWPKNTYRTSDWIPSINLITFKMYNGAYPSTQRIKELVADLKDAPQNDWSINNMVIRGNKISFVDLDDPTFGPGSPYKGRKYSTKVYAAHCELIDLKNPENVERYFWKGLDRPHK